jgi:hypothetical protein
MELEIRWPRCCEEILNEGYIHMLSLEPPNMCQPVYSSLPQARVPVWVWTTANNNNNNNNNNHGGCIFLFQHHWALGSQPLLSAQSSVPLGNCQLRFSTKHHILQSSNRHHLLSMATSQSIPNLLLSSHVFQHLSHISLQHNGKVFADLWYSPIPTTATCPWNSLLLAAHATAYGESLWLCAYVNSHSSKPLTMRLSCSRVHWAHHSMLCSVFEHISMFFPLQFPGMTKACVLSHPSSALLPPPSTLPISDLSFSD